LGKNPPIFIGKRVGGNLTAATNTHAKIEQLLDLSFSVGSVSYQRKVGNQFFPELLAFIAVVIRSLFVDESRSVETHP
jgi:hypothetical protein